jgi:hypothetical protein
VSGRLVIAQIAVVAGEGALGGLFISITTIGA